MVVDRFGSRRPAVAGVVLAATAVTLFALNDGTILRWWSLWLFFAAAALFIQPVMWTTAVTKTFVASRGMGLSVALCGTALGSVLAPLVAHWLITGYGWRAAYALLGSCWGSFVLVVILVKFFDSGGARTNATPDVQRNPEALLPAGLSFREAWATSAIQKLAVTCLLMTIVNTATNLHLVPILTSGGLSRGAAASLASLFGLIAITAKLTTGWLLDRMNPLLLAAGSFSLPIIGSTILLLYPATFPVALLVVLIFGWAGGAYLQLESYLVAHFAGVRNFGKIFGVFGSLISLGAGVGPFLAALVYDARGDYAWALIGIMPIVLVCALLVTTLGQRPALAHTS
jgi:MFS family permease